MKQTEDLKQGLRQGMRCLASGVCVVSGLGDDGERCAMTASSVTSVSNEPPSLLVCINKSARMDDILKGSSNFCINVLGSDHQKVSEICATPDKTEERFETGSWKQHEKTGLFYVDQAPAVFVCEKQKVVDYGSHSIFIANIHDVLLADEKQPLLVYADGQYHFL